MTTTPTPTRSATRAKIEHGLAGLPALWTTTTRLSDESFQGIVDYIATALATAEAAGWRAGRDAADQTLMAYCRRCFERGAEEGEPLWGTIAGHVSLLRDQVRALTPPGAA